MNDQYRNAIGSVESDNDYGALGPETDSGDRAYGRYQVMGANIPQWTQRHLGTSMTPQQFLKDHDAQDRVFDGETSNAYQKYGNLDDVTSTWFSGRPMKQAGNASDGYNTTPQYIAKVNAAFNGNGTRKNAMASADDTDTPAALSSRPPAGPLSQGGKTNWLDTLGQTMMNVAPGLASISSPSQAQALAAIAAAQAKTQGTWSTNYDARTGMATQTSSDGKGMRQWKYAEPTKDDRKWGVIKAADPVKGTPAVEGYIPTQDAYEAQEEANKNNPPAETPDTSSLTGPEFMDALTKNRGAQYANNVQAIVDGRALMPTASSRQPGAAQLRADALQADRTLQEGTGPARVKLRAAYETSTAPGSPAVQMRQGNTSLDHGGNLSDEIENLKSFNDHADSAIPGVSYGLNYAHNKTLAGQSTPEAQAYSSLQTHINNFASEKAKFLGGGVAGEHEKARILDLYDLNKSLPELRAGMAADAEDVKAKQDELQNGWRTGNDNSPLVKDFNIMSKEGQAGYDRIVERHNRTKDGGYVQPSGSKSAAPAVPQNGRPSLGDIFK